MDAITYVLEAPESQIVAFLVGFGMSVVVGSAVALVMR